jgi:hypothetical protein
MQHKPKARPTKSRARKAVLASAADPSTTSLFYLVLVREDADWPELHTFSTRDALVAFLKDVKSGCRVRAYIFRGRRLLLSKGPHRCLLDGQEPPIPLFGTKVCRQPDPDDYLWDDPL